ncbi:MAG: von Willebrand factor [Firmicutes bacterium]|nr:von Willebrand factor [Bacillota bacterium]
MKKLFLTVLLLLTMTTAWAAPGDLQDRLKTTELAQAIEVTAMPLEDVLSLLSRQSGIRMIAVPEAAEMVIDLQLPAHQTVEQIIEALQQKYYLTFQHNDSNNTIVVLKSSEQEQYWLTAAPSTFTKGGMMMARAEYASAPAAYSNQMAYYTPAYSHNTEEYTRISDVSFQTATTNALSTFSIDVDTASYSNIRRYINSGKLPPADAVRTEELLNYFTYDYPQPTGDHPFSLTTEVGACPWNPAHQLVLIGLQGKTLQPAEIPPSNLVFLIDVSGSMSASNKLPLLKTAFHMLVNQLRPEDKVSIVVYAGNTGVSLEATSGSEKGRIHTAIDNLQAGGSTNGGEGIKLAYKIAKNSLIDGGNNRVILATDGDFNVGVSSEGELSRLIEERRDDGIFLSVLGFGMSNIKDNKMETLADKGNGNYAYIDNAMEAKKVLGSQLAGTLYTIAKDVKLQVEFNPAKVKQYRLIGYENRTLAASDFNNDKKDAGDMGAGHSVTALYEIVPADSEESGVSVDPLVYQKPTVIPSEDLLQVKVRYKKPNKNTSTLFTKQVKPFAENCLQSDNFRFAAAVAEYAMLLRNSEFKANSSYQQVLDLARSAKGPDTQGYRAEFIRMVEVSEVVREY